MINGPQKGQRGRNVSLVEMNVGWQANTKTLLRLPAAAASADRRLPGCYRSLCHVRAFCVRERAALVICAGWARLFALRLNQGRYRWHSQSLRHGSRFGCHFM